MADAKDFMHLPFPVKRTGEAKYPQSHVPGQHPTERNKQNRQAHHDGLRSQAQTLSRFWQDRRNTRNSQNLPTIAGGIPFLLEIEPTTDVEFLRGLGFEIVCDLDEGFIVVSSEQTDLTDFLQKVDGFVSKTPRTGSVAKVYALHADDNRLKRILSKELYDEWPVLDNNRMYVVEISVSCAGISSPPNLPKQKAGESDDEYNKRIKTQKDKYYQDINTIQMERQGQLENIVNDYEGNFLTSFIEDGDTFSATIQISGNGLRDVVLNYSYIFEVSFKSEVIVDTVTENLLIDANSLSISSPPSSSPSICVIDSGIQESHKYIEDAILASDSISLLPDQTNTADEITGGGHGTRVAGAVLYPEGIPPSGNYQLPCFIRNIKILDQSNAMPDDVSREGVIDTAVKKFAVESQAKTKIFNHSIGERKPFYELKHMSPWAAKIDEVSYEHDVLFVQAAGNIQAEIIKAHIQAGHKYPDYLGHELSQISNPAQSFQALTVGSISHSDFENDDSIAMGKDGESSSFTRVGPGIWDSIKPDVVEYGGTHVINKQGAYINLTTPEEVCPELIRRSPPGPAFSKDAIGTSFSTPKITYIASEIQKIFPDSHALLYRALIVQSARWVNANESLSSEQCQNMLRRIGYGLPNIDRATHNDEYRVTLITNNLLEIGDHEAHIFTVNIPQELRDLGEDYNVLLEITLSYASKTKRTRRTHRSYLSTWLDWTCSKKNESRQDFESRIFNADSTGQDDGHFPWMIHERQNWGIAKNFARPRQTLQKDWCIVKASQLSDEFCIAVRGHKGWGSLFKAKYALAVSFEAIDQNIEIYEPIRISNRVEIETTVDAQEINVEVDLS